MFEPLCFYDKPDYDKMLKILERARDLTQSLYLKSKLSILVDKQVKLFYFQWF